MAPLSRQEFPNHLLHTGCRKVTDARPMRDGLLPTRCMQPSPCAGKCRESAQCQRSQQQAPCVGCSLRSKVKELEGCAAGDVGVLQDLLDALQGESLRLKAALSAAVARVNAPSPVAAHGKHPEASEGRGAAPADAPTLPFLARCRGPRAAGSAGAGVGLLFPGIGSEYVSMLADCLCLPGVTTMLAKANTILGYDIKDLCLQGPYSKLADPRYSYPALFIGGLAGLERLHREEEDLAGSFRAVSGIGVGEYTALCAAGVCSFEDGLRLVKIAGEIVQQSAACSQGFVVILGLEKSVVRGLCARAVKAEGGASLCEVAVDLAPGCYGCAGTAKAVSALGELARSAGAFEVKAAGHHCACALHTRLVKSGQEKMETALREVLPRMSPPKCEFYSVLTGLPMGPDTNPAEIVRLLAEHWTRPVSWEALFRNMIRDGVTKFFELGPLTQCKDIMGCIDRKAWKAMRNMQV